MKSKKPSPRKKTVASPRSRKKATPRSSVRASAVKKSSVPPRKRAAKPRAETAPPKTVPTDAASPVESTLPPRAEIPVGKTATPVSSPEPTYSRPKPPPAARPQESKPKPKRKVPARIPPILLEGDRPSTPLQGGPGRRYALGSSPPLESSAGEGELPVSYGTNQLLLAARDPHWLYASWDFTPDQQREYNSLSADRHLIIRVFVDNVSGRAVEEIHVHPESRFWFIHVSAAGTRYIAQLGYFDVRHQWIAVATSGSTLTPPDSVSTDTHAEFATIPFELPMAKLLEIVKDAVAEHLPLAAAVQELRAQGHPDLPPAASTPPAKWTPDQERALAAIISMDNVRRVWMGSMEITELIRRHAAQELASMVPAGLNVSQPTPASPMEAFGAITSPMPSGAQRGNEFWFNVNAELIVYGATEPDATVTIGGRRIKLRPDGSFSYRFALPDGKYEMSVVAVSSDETDGRAAEMKFGRETEYRGDVGAHPQDPQLEKMSVESF